MSFDVALSVMLLFSAGCYLLLGLRLIALKREIGSMPIGVLFVVISLWVAGGAIELLASTYTVFSIGRTGHFIGTALAPIVAFVCFREFTGSGTPARTLALLSIVPIISVSLAATVRGSDGGAVNQKREDGGANNRVAVGRVHEEKPGAPALWPASS